MDLWKSLSGMLTLEFTSAAPEKTIEEIMLLRIPLFNILRKDELTCQIRICRTDYRKLSGILLRRGDNWRILRKQGIFWTAEALLHRPILLFLFLLLFCSSVFLPSRIFFITVDGNTAIPDKLILSAAEKCGVRFGALRKEVRSEKVKNALLSEVPQLQWAGINTSGCTAVISVREQAEVDLAPEKKGITSLVADRDGFILSMTVTGGTAQVAPGEAVKKGQLLISGYTDGGICIRACEAEGEIIALTQRHLEAMIPQIYAFPTSNQETKYAVSLIIGKKRINLWKDSSISNTCCGRMYEEYFVSLPGGFPLPVGICVDRYTAYELQERTLSDSDAQLQLSQFSEKYLLRQMVAGQILQAKQNFFCKDALYRLESEFTCTEILGREHREQIGVINGKGN